MDALPSTLNAKQRRKLLREQQRQQAEGATAAAEAAAAESVDVKQEPPAAVKEEPVVKPEPEPVKEEPVKTEADAAAATTQDSGAQLNTKERRRLARLEKQVAEDAKADVAVAADGEQLNAQQRRLLKRQAKRKAEGVEETKPPQKKQKQNKKQQTDEDGKPANHKSIHLTLFVGQLPFRATEASIRKHFAEAGEIKLRMLTDKKTKKFKGTAFIEVKDSKALGAALSRHHTLLQGRRINVELTASGGGNKSENRRNKIDLLRKKQSNVQVEKTKALIQKHIDGPEYKLQKEDVDDRMIDFLSWFDYETAKKALDEYNRCVSDLVNNRKAFFMGILKRFRQTDGVE